MPPVQLLKERTDSISIKELSDLTMFKTDDIISTLQVHPPMQFSSQSQSSKEGVKAGTSPAEPQRAVAGAKT